MTTQPPAGTPDRPSKRQRLLLSRWHRNSIGKRAPWIKCREFRELRRLGLIEGFGGSTRDWFDCGHEHGFRLTDRGRRVLNIK